MIQGYEKVPCKWCGVGTFMTHTKRCDRCWELQGRIQRNPDLATRMLFELKPTLFVALRRFTSEEGFEPLAVCPTSDMAKILCRIDCNRLTASEFGLTWTPILEAVTGYEMGWMAHVDLRHLYEVRLVVGTNITEG